MPAPAPGELPSGDGEAEQGRRYSLVLLFACLSVLLCGSLVVLGITLYVTHDSLLPPLPKDHILKLDELYIG